MSTAKQQNIAGSKKFFTIYLYITIGSTTTKEALGGFSCYPDCGANDQSVPIYNAYNHHYFSWLVGSDAKMYEREEATFLPNPTKTGFQTKVGFLETAPNNSATFVYSIEQFKHYNC